MLYRTTISISEARKNIFKLADAVQSPDTYYFLTEKGKTKAVMMSAEEFEIWQETLEIMMDKSLMKNIEKELLQLQKKKKMGFSSWKDIKAQLLIPPDVSQQKNLSGRSQQNRRKKSQKN